MKGLAGVLRRDASAALGVALIVGFALAAVAGPLLTRSDPNHVDLLRRFSSASLAHPLGTDYLGRDELSRLLYGARVSISMALVASVGTTLLGIGLGVLAGVFGKTVDAVIMRAVDALQALPGLVLALAVLGLLGPGLPNLLASIIVAWWAGYARVVRGMALSIRERPFVEAARALGASRSRIVVRHVLPNLLGPTIVLSTVDMGRILLAVAGLSFLGLGVRPPTAEWGAMLSEARDYLDRAPMLLVLPGAAITLLALACNLVGDGLRDALDPRLQRHVAADSAAMASTSLEPARTAHRHPVGATRASPI